MVNREHMRLCVLLAFQSMLTHGSAPREDGTKRIIGLARQMYKFCDAHLSTALREDDFSFAETSTAHRADMAIGFLHEVLKRHEPLNLPNDREELVWLYDRLQQRKIQRTQWQFYATAPKEKLVELILGLLSEESKDSQIRGLS